MLNKPKTKHCRVCRALFVPNSSFDKFCGSCRGGQYTMVYERASKNAKAKALGRNFDSKFEGSVAESLQAQKDRGEILDFDCQYPIDLCIYRADGAVAFRKRWKVDFRIHELDGSFTLKEAKGMIVEDYRWKREILTKVWLPAHLDYSFVEVRQGR